MQAFFVTLDVAMPIGDSSQQHDGKLKSLLKIVGYALGSVAVLLIGLLLFHAYLKAK